MLENGLPKLLKAPIVKILPSEDIETEYPHSSPVSSPSNPFLFEPEQWRRFERVIRIRYHQFWQRITILPSNVGTLFTPSSAVFFTPSITDSQTIQLLLCYEHYSF